MKNILGRKEKIELIKNVVENSFEIDRYLKFLKEVLGGQIFVAKGPEAREGNKKIKEDELVGELTEKIKDSKESSTLGLFIIKYENLNPNSDKRRINRSYISNLLKNKYPKYNKALVAFYSPYEGLWRLSLIEVEDAFKSEDIVPLKMNSHIMGCGKRSDAALQMILQILEKPKKKGNQGIDLIFDEEKLLEGFFKTFSEKYHDLKGRVEKSQELMGFLERENIDKVSAVEEVSKRMITQFIVLYFIEKKGWLGAKRNESLENGDFNFISNFYKTCSGKEENFYDGCLKSMFYDGFSKCRDENLYMEELGCKVPYFDIELFKPHLDIKDKNKIPSIKIENDFFYGDGNGILEFFHGYYFSLIENEPYLKDMVVDPEMLGKVFENLLDSDYRKSKGTYYTPRIIVHFMCKKTLANYIYNYIKSTSKDKREIIDEKEIINLIFLLEFYWNEDKVYLKNTKNKSSKELKIPDNIYNRLDEIDNALKGIKVVEPSTGSGAFLLGMLGELFKLRKLINRYKSVYNQIENGRERVIFSSREDYLLKASIIEKNLYGIDIDISAVETCNLRLWMSLMADATKEDEKYLREYKKNIYCGNSITMDWNARFPSVLEDGGFDIVIGNPPYVGEKGNKDIFREIVVSPLGKKYYKGKGDLFYFFFHLGLEILKDRGTLAYITTNYYITADGAIKLREDIKKRSNILQMIDFNEVNIFSRARGQHNIITVLEKSLEKDRKGRAALCEIVGELSPLTMSKYLAGRYEYGNYATLNQEEFYRGEKNYIYLEKNSISTILEKMTIDSVPLKNEVNVNQGIVSGADKITPRHLEKFGVSGEKGEGIFSLSVDEVDNLRLNQDEEGYLGMFFKNSNIDRYICDEVSERKIIYITREDTLENLPMIKKHLERFKSVLANKREAKNGMIPWYSLHWPREKSIFLGKKIVAPQRSKRNVFAYNDTQWYASADVYYITPKRGSRLSLKYITALLNSKLYYVWLYKRGKRKGELLELYATPIEDLPIKLVKESIQIEFETLVDKIISAKRKGQATGDIEGRIDEMVCDIYGLEEAEREEIYTFYRGKLEK